MAQADGTIYINTAIQTDGMKAGGKDVEAAARRMAKSVSGIGEAAKLALQKQTDSFVRQNQLYAQQEQRVASLKAKLDELKEQKVETKEYASVNSEIRKLEASIQRAIEKKKNLETSGKEKQLTAEYKAAEKEVSRLEKALSNAIERREKFLETGGKKKSKAFKGMEYDIKKLEIQLRQAIKDKENLESSKHEKTTSFQNIEKEVQSLTAELEKAKEKRDQLEGNGEAYESVDTSIVEERLANAQEKLKESGNRLGTSYEQLKQKILGFGGSLDESSKYAEYLQATLLGLKRALQVIGIVLLSIPISILKTFANAAKKATLALLNLVKSSIIKGFKKLASAIGRAALSLSGLNKQAKKSKNSFGKALKTILKYTLGIRSMYILVNKIRTGIKEGFSNLAQYSDETNKNISALMSALTQLKNSLATAFNPILTVVTPALTKFINMISQAATYVGMFIAAMTGQKSFVKAIAVQEDYAAGLKDTANAAEEAEKATDSYLSGLDEVKRFETSDISKKDENEGYKPPTPQDMFETVPIEQSIANMVQKIKDLIKNEDWEGLGAYMASGINSGLQKVYDVINWDNVGPKITYFINAFTTSLNSLVDNIDWDLMGRVVGAGINTLVNSFNLLVEGIDFENLGAKISTGFRGMLDEVEWTEFGKAIGNKFMIGWRIFDGFVTDMWRKNNAGLTGWSQLGISIGNALNGIVQKIDLGKIGASLGKAITGIFQTAIDFSRTFDWKEVGINIANGINRFLENFDAKTVAVGTSEVIKGILDALITAVQNTDWELLGSKIAEFLANIDWAGISERLFELIGSLFGGLAKFLIGLIGDAFSSIKLKMPKSVNELGEFLIKGMLTGVLGAFTNIGDWIKKHIFDPFINGFKKAFGIHSPSTVMQEQGHYIMQGLLNGITSWKEKLASTFGGIKDLVLGKWDETKKGTNEKWNGIKNSLFADWGELKTDASGKFGGIGDSVKEAWNSIKSSTSSIWGEIASAIKKPINSIISMLNSMVSGMVSAVNNVIGTLNKLKVKVPKWVPKYGGETFGFNIKKVSAPKIPYLASGAVIPPNAPFLAMMGDQRHGNNLEMPEALLRKVVREESGRNQQQGGGTYRFTGVINRRVLFDEMMTEAQLRMMSNGKNPYTALG